MNLKSLKTSAIANAKNLIGWRTKRKIIVISVDDYGNVRLDSKEARKNLDEEGLSVKNRFDALDTLETKQDLEMLYEVLRSVKDKNNRNPVITAYAVPCNINFEKVAESGYQDYYYELLPETYQKLSELDPNAYSGAWELWKEGMKTGLVVPQFHGREHLNVKVFREKLAVRDHDLMTCLKNRSFTSFSNSKNGQPSPMSAFDFEFFEENKGHQEIIIDGIKQFEKVFECRPRNFTPPVYCAHPVLYKALSNNGIRYVDTALIANEHQGKGNYKKKFNYTGKRAEYGLFLMVRNVVFEPNQNRDVDWVSYALKQIEAAFRWNRPAIISSHRVNFCGHIDESNRKEGLSALKKLLKEITHRWPEVEFLSADELGGLIASSQKG